MKTTTYATRILAPAALLFAAVSGCNKKADNTINYKNAIDAYYSARPVCLWDTSKQFPAQADTSGSGKTSELDALVDQGLLTRTTAEKKVFIVASKQVNNYDLSDKGRSAWTADTTQPGFGNFCYGHRKVDGIDSSTPTTSDPGAVTQVVYHYSLTGIPAWANAAETQTAFPTLQANLASQTAQATLTNTSNGWQLTAAPGDRTRTPPTAADGQIVK